jgi:hypothetical protein
MRINQIILLLFFGSIDLGFSVTITTISQAAEIACDSSPNLEPWQEPKVAEMENIVTAETISQERLSVPSLWWARESIDPFLGKSIDNWNAYPQRKQIDLIVNWQLWNLLDYIQKYAFVNKFGTIARGYGYNLRIINQQNKCLAIYYYNARSNSQKWEIYFNPLEVNSLQPTP